jgi:hypothetical protein
MIEVAVQTRGSIKPESPNAEVCMIFILLKSTEGRAD